MYNQIETFSPEHFALLVKNSINRPLYVKRIFGYSDWMVYTISNEDSLFRINIRAWDSDTLYIFQSNESQQYYGLLASKDHGGILVYYDDYIHGTTLTTGTHRIDYTYAFTINHIQEIIHAQDEKCKRKWGQAEKGLNFSSVICGFWLSFFLLIQGFLIDQLCITQNKYMSALSCIVYICLCFIGVFSTTYLMLIYKKTACNLFSHQHSLDDGNKLYTYLNKRNTFIGCTMIVLTILYEASSYFWWLFQNQYMSVAELPMTFFGIPGLCLILGILLILSSKGSQKK